MLFKSVQEVSKHATRLTWDPRAKSLILRYAPGRARTCNPMIRSHILRLLKAPVNAPVLGLKILRNDGRGFNWVIRVASAHSLPRALIQRPRSKGSHGNPALEILAEAFGWDGISLFFADDQKLAPGQFLHRRLAHSPTLIRNGAGFKPYAGVGRIAPNQRHHPNCTDANTNDSRPSFIPRLVEEIQIETNECLHAVEDLAHNRTQLVPLSHVPTQRAARKIA